MSIIISEQEAELIPQFRKSLQDVWREEFQDDYYLLRWIRAREHDLKKAEKMLRDHLDWRRRENIDDILNYVVPEVIQKYYPGGFCGHDKDGSPLWVEPVGMSDPQGLSQAATKSDTLRSRLQMMEQVHKVLLPKRSLEEGHRVVQTVVMFDLTNLGMKHLWKPALQYFTEFTQLVEANYPETMKRCYVINAPSFFPFVYKLISPFLHVNTQKKIIVFGTNREEFQEALLKDFEPEHLPACYGGTLHDPEEDPRCSGRICWGGDVPEEYFLKCNLEYMHETTVGRGSTLKLDYAISKPGTRIQWEFQTQDHDIGFGVFMRSPQQSGEQRLSPSKHQKTKDMLEVVPTKRYNAFLAREKNSVEVTVEGHYVIRFDNTYSWTRSKRLWYRIEVEEPLPENLAEASDAEASAFLKEVQNSASGVGDARPVHVFEEKSSKEPSCEETSHDEAS